ncbi:DUF4240 domain-containing protein [Nonomuraea longicatena]|uniref:DUF4240 domain-containing protein n=1 Tax=Nonomuraea longicatena TaxID=83682 RepID=A0ABN1NT03_9ACTN
MDVDAFWALIEQSGRETSTKRSRREWLENQLGGRPADDIIDFQKWLTLCEYQGNTWDVWGAGTAAFLTSSADSFLYFRRWLIGLGRETFERVIADPETLFEIPETRNLIDLRTWTAEEWPEFEFLGYVAFKPYRDRAGLDLCTLHEQAAARAGLGEDWDTMRGTPPDHH